MLNPDQDAHSLPKMSLGAERSINHAEIGGTTGNFTGAAPQKRKQG
jgi:hypothetical protein